MPNKNRKPKKIVIIGGGFGGLYAARKLSGLGNKVSVTLIDKRNHHLFQPLLYQVATGGLSPGDIASPLRAILSNGRNMKVVKGEVTDFDPDKQVVYGDKFAAEYDELIIATGSTHHYFGNEHWEKNAPGLKTIEDAVNIRARIFDAFERAEVEVDEDERKRLLTFVVAGGGPTGVELAGAIGELCKRTVRGEFTNFKPENSRIVLVEGTDRILLTYHPRTSKKAVKSLERLGVEVICGKLVTDIEADKAKIESKESAELVYSRNVFWAAGVKASDMGRVVADRCQAELDKTGRVRVNKDLSVPGYANVRVIGDLAYLEDKHGEPLPGVATVAMQQGKYVAGLLKDRIKGKKKNKPFDFNDRGSMAVIGRNAAVAEVGKLKISGFWAWLVWIFVHIAYLIEFENKLLVMIQWAGDYFTRKRGARLITGPCENYSGRKQDKDKSEQELVQL